jgi:hypothetical protein
MRSIINRVTVALLLVAAAGARAFAGDPREAVGVEIARASKVDATVRDYTCISTKQERIDGKLLPRETFLLKHRREPNCVYLKWLQEPFKNRETIYCPARYGEKLKNHEGSGIAGWLGTLSLDPRGKLAMTGNRHSLVDAGIFHVLAIVRSDFERGKMHPDHGVRFENLHEENVLGQPSFCWQALQPANSALGYYAPRSETCLHLDLHLPTRATVLSDSDEVVENYTWSDYKLNVGLGDADFDTENPEYGF